MMNDTVREELQTKITQRSAIPTAPPAERKPAPPAAIIAPPRPHIRPQTANLSAPKTSPTLVGFQTKNTSIPEWRLQMQNAVQQRKSTHGAVVDSGHHFPTNGGAALKAEPAPEPIALPEIEDSRVANALRRIERSREAFSEPAIDAKKTVRSTPAPLRPFGIVAPTKPATNGFAQTSIPAAPKPRLVAPTPTPLSARRDTNKLPPLNVTLGSVGEIEHDPVVADGQTGFPSPEFGEINRIRIKAETVSNDGAGEDDIYEDEIEDLAPISMRFGAGLFDLITGTFGGMLIISPLAFSRSDWFTTSAVLVFAGTTAIVTFLYMTLCLGFFGKTLGMRLFSLELVDALENEYPSLQQAAVNSAVFILSLGFAGAGFLTIFFNEENRAAHDLASGTILVREF